MQCLNKPGNELKPEKDKTLHESFTPREGSSLISTEVLYSFAKVYLSVSMMN